MIGYDGKNAYVRCFFFFVKQKTAYEMRISDWSSDVCSSDLSAAPLSPSPASPSKNSEGGFAPSDGALGEAQPFAVRRTDRACASTATRSVVRRVGQECVSTCRSRASPSHSKKHDKKISAHTASTIHYSIPLHPPNHPY